MHVLLTLGGEGEMLRSLRPNWATWDNNNKKEQKEIASSDLFKSKLLNNIISYPENLL